jgi:hypothetical protein
MYVVNAQNSVDGSLTLSLTEISAQVPAPWPLARHPAFHGPGFLPRTVQLSDSWDDTGGQVYRPHV